MKRNKIKQSTRSRCNPKRWAASLCIAMMVGCSVAPQTDYGKLGLIDVTGVITLDGNPLPYAVVTFEDPETGQFSYGQTDESGYYEMQLDTEMSGVVPGDKVVRISTTKKILGLNSGEEGGASEGEAEEGDAEPSAADTSHELVPAKYNKDSELRASVSASETTFDFDLKSE